jgi:hypothetical protein
MNRETRKSCFQYFKCFNFCKYNNFEDKINEIEEKIEINHKESLYIINNCIEYVEDNINKINEMNKLNRLNKIDKINKIEYNNNSRSRSKTI